MAARQLRRERRSSLSSLRRDLPMAYDSRQARLG